jgi:hypothetical protein
MTIKVYIFPSLPTRLVKEVNSEVQSTIVIRSVTRLS